MLNEQEIKIILENFNDEESILNEIALLKAYCNLDCGVPTTAFCNGKCGMHELILVLKKKLELIRLELTSKGKHYGSKRKMRA